MKMAEPVDIRPTPLGDTEKTHCSGEEVEKDCDTKHIERSAEQEFIYADEEEEPELHARTYLALFAMFLLNYVMVIALQSPPAVLPYIGRALNATRTQTWIPNSLSLVQAVLGPLISLASDTFQARKSILVGSCLVSFIGAAIAPGSTSIDRLIAAQTLIGVGFSAVPLAYAVPSEILPRRWRPLAQGFCNVAAICGSISGPLIIGILVKRDPESGWKTFYWIEFAMWGITAAALFFAYRPPHRPVLTELTIWQKLGKLDLVGNGLLTAGLTLFIVGLNLGGGMYAWTNAKTLVTLIIGGLTLIAFGLYEWKGTSTGVLHHELFRGPKSQGRTFSLCVALMFLEGILVFAFVIFFPVMSVALFETDPFLQACRALPFWVATIITTVLYSVWSAKARDIRTPLFVGFAIFTAGIGAFASIRPGDGFNQLAIAALAGIGFGSPLILVVTGVQLACPHKLLATATAITTSSRAVAIAIFTAVYSAAFNEQIAANLPRDVGAAAQRAGLPASSIPAFVTALSGDDTAALENINGVTPSVITAGVMGLQQAYADSIRVVFYIAIPFGVLACIGCLFLGDLRKTMNFRVDAPIEALHAKHHHHHEAEETA